MNKDRFSGARKMPLESIEGAARKGFGSIALNNHRVDYVRCFYHVLFKASSITDFSGVCRAYSTTTFDNLH